MSAYANYREFGQVAHQPKDADASVFTTLLERASRVFDLLCSVEANHFASVTYALWQSNTVYEVGDIVIPTTSNAHKYRVTTAGTSVATEPTWPTGAASTVVNGTVTFTENGTDVLAPTSQVFYGNGTAYLQVPAHTDTITISDVTMPSGYTVPYLVDKDGYLIVTDSNGLQIRETWPTQYALNGYWPAGVPVTVSAIWGQDGAPSDIKDVVIELAISMWRQNDPATARTSDLPAVKKELSPLAKAIIDKYSFKSGVAFV